MNVAGLTELSDLQLRLRRFSAHRSVRHRTTDLQLRGITFSVLFLKRGVPVARLSGMSLFKTITLVCAGALLAFVGSAMAAFI
jgi:hypothetical protein